MCSYKYLLGIVFCLATFSLPVQANRVTYFLGGVTEFSNQVVTAQTIPLVLSAAGQAIPSALIFQVINLLDSTEQMASYWTGHQPVIAPYNPSRLLFRLASGLELTPIFTQVIKPLFTDEWDIKDFKQGRQDYVWIATMYNGLFSLCHLASMGFQVFSKPAPVPTPARALVPVRGLAPVYPSEVTTVQTVGSALLALCEQNEVGRSQFAAAVMKILGPHMRDNLDPFRDGEALGCIRMSDLYGLKKYLGRNPSIALPQNALSEAFWYARGKETGMVQYLRSLKLPEPVYSQPITAFKLEWGPLSETALTLSEAMEYCSHKQGSEWRLPRSWELFAFYQSSIPLAVGAVWVLDSKGDFMLLQCSARGNYNSGHVHCVRKL